MQALGTHEVSAGLKILANVAIAAGPAVLCVKFVLFYVQGWISEFRFPRQTQKGGPVFC